VTHLTDPPAVSEVFSPALMTKKISNRLSNGSRHCAQPNLVLCYSEIVHGQLIQLNWLTHPHSQREKMNGGRCVFSDNWASASVIRRYSSARNQMQTERRAGQRLTINDPLTNNLIVRYCFNGRTVVADIHICTTTTYWRSYHTWTET
jgi:hypothetical protein